MPLCSCPWEAPKSKFSKEKELTIEEWKNILTVLVDKGIVNIAFSGGEPLMKKGIEELIVFAANLKAKHIETVD